MLDVRLRNLELQLNEIFEAYAAEYYGADNAITSVYIWDGVDSAPEKFQSPFVNPTPDEELVFEGVFLLKKTVGSRGTRISTWDSVHQIRLTEVSAKKLIAAKTGTATTIGIYKLVSTIFLTMEGADSSKFGACICKAREEKHRKVEDDTVMRHTLLMGQNYCIM